MLKNALEQNYSNMSWIMEISASFSPESKSIIAGRLIFTHIPQVARYLFFTKHLE